MRILGIDPGSRVTGYGCVEIAGNQMVHVTHGSWKLGSANLESRLLALHGELDSLVSKWKPQVLAVERVFFAKNALSALKLGQVRGIVLLAGAIHGLEVVEYAPTEIKAAVTGHGGAQKEQVARAVQLLTGRKDFPTHDASDALALAICHCQRELTRQKLLTKSVKSASRGVTAQEMLEHIKKPKRSRGRGLAESLGFSASGVRMKRRD